MIGWDLDIGRWNLPNIAGLVRGNRRGEGVFVEVRWQLPCATAAAGENDLLKSVAVALDFDGVIRLDLAGRAEYSLVHDQFSWYCKVHVTDVMSPAAALLVVC